MTAPASRSFAAAATALVALACLSACSGGDDTPLPPVGETQPPIARLWAPVFASPSREALLDASDSQSPGGALAHYRFDFGDGSPTVDQGSPLAVHTYANEGVYAVSLAVVDVSGEQAQVQSQVTIRIDPPPCATDADCSAGQRCQAATCAVHPPCAQICLAEVGSATP